MANVLLGVTGSVAAIRTPMLFDALRAEGHTVKVVATNASLYFFDPAALAPRDGRRDPDVVSLDEDEWPGEFYTRTDTVLHIELRRWAEIVVLAPLDANTLAKLAVGLCDNCLTCVWRARDRAQPCVVAPAMNTLMWTAPITARQLTLLAEDNPGLRIVPPQVKRLACDDVGIGAMAEPNEIVAVVRELLANRNQVPR